MSELIDATIFAGALVIVAICVAMIATRYEMQELERWLEENEESEDDS